MLSMRPLKNSPSRSMSEFHLLVRTPEKDVYDGTVLSIAFNGESGRAQVLAHHADFTSTILFSHVKVESESESRAETFLVRNGIFNFDHKKNAAVLLALYAEVQSEVSYKTTEEYLRFLTEELTKGDLSEFQVLSLKGEKLAVEKQIKNLQ